VAGAGKVMPLTDDQRRRHEERAKRIAAEKAKEAERIRSEARTHHDWFHRADDKADPPDPPFPRVVVAALCRGLERDRNEGEWRVYGICAGRDSDTRRWVSQHFAPGMRPFPYQVHALVEAGGFEGAVVVTVTVKPPSAWRFQAASGQRLALRPGAEHPISFALDFDFDQSGVWTFELWIEKWLAYRFPFIFTLYR
jgi:hypothetical protein